MKNIVNKAFILSALCVGTLFPMEKPNITPGFDAIKKGQYMKYHTIKKLAKNNDHSSTDISPFSSNGFTIISRPVVLRNGSKYHLVKCFPNIFKSFTVPNPYRKERVDNARTNSTLEEIKYILLTDKDFCNKENWQSYQDK